MNRAIKSLLATAGLMVALSAPAYAEHGVNGAAAGTSANGAYNETATNMYGTDRDRNGRTDLNTYTRSTTNNDNAYRRYGINSAGVGNNNMTSQRLRAQAADDNGMDWGWLGLLGLIGLAGLRGRGRETT